MPFQHCLGNDMNDSFGEIAEVYTQKALLQLQRMVVKRANKPLHTVMMTIAPKVNGKVDFSSKKVINLEEEHLAELCQALMGLKHRVQINGNRKDGGFAKALYINLNQDETVNVIFSMYSQNSESMGKDSLGITFSPAHRYKLLTIAVSQLTLNSVGYKQTMSETLSLLKASAFKAYR